jgi:hypothetical protein
VRREVTERVWEWRVVVARVRKEARRRSFIEWNSLGGVR